MANIDGRPGLPDFGLPFHTGSAAETRAGMATVGSSEGLSWEFEEVRLRGMASAVESLGARMVGASIVHSDPDGLVTVTVDGTGDILDIRCHARVASHPERLGQLMTEVLAEAREETERRQDRMVKELPFELPGKDQILDVLSRRRPPDPPQDDDWILAAREAEIMDFLTALRALFEEHKTRFIESPIEDGLGMVSTGLSGEQVTVEINPRAPRLIDLHRLESQILAAINEAQKRAALVSEEEFAAVKKTHDLRMI